MTRRPVSPAAVVALLTVAAVCIADAQSTAPATSRATAGPQPQSLPTIMLTLNHTPLTLQVADDDAERETGLMHTRTMPADRGMIFVFPTDEPREFWMHDTPIDLDIVYVNRVGTVVAVRTMRAFDEHTTPSDGPATYAIELNAGMAGILNLKAGQHLELPATLLKSVR